MTDFWRIGLKINTRDTLLNLDKETLISMLEDSAKNWLAHDGLWFLEVEAGRDMKEAILYDTGAWKRFTVIEAKRIMYRHSIPENSGLEGLEKALKFRMYAYINEMSIEKDAQSLSDTLSIISFNTSKFKFSIL